MQTRALRKILNFISYRICSTDSDDNDASIVVKLGFYWSSVFLFEHNLLILSGYLAPKIPRSIVKNIYSEAIVGSNSAPV